MKIADIAISRRLFLGFGILMFLIVAMAMIGINRLANLDAQMTDVINDKYPKTIMAGDIIDQINLVARSVRNVLLLKDPQEIQSENARITGAEQAIADRLSQLDKQLFDPESRTLLENLLKAKQNYDLQRDKVLQLVANGDKERAIELLISDVRPVQNAYMSASAQLIKKQHDLMQASGEAITSNYHSASAVLESLAAAGLLLAAAIAYLITRSITVPLKRAVLVAQTVAAGDLTSHIKASSKDETGQLLSALSTMNGNLQTIGQKVQHSTDTIATASAEIASGNLDLSSRTEEQAGSLEETASAMEEMTATVTHNADNARQANQLALSASVIAQQGGDIVGQVINTMGSINASSHKIVEIISVIDGIAFQTNILALNAAVEAARAGEQGRGFAVVASEVRSLAQRSASAAKEIKLLINDSVEKVGSGSKLVSQAGSTMEEVVASVQRLADVVGEITAAGTEQSEGITQINRAITQMDQTTQQNAALVEQAAAAAQSLQDQTIQLLEVIKIFKVEERPTASSLILQT